MIVLDRNHGVFYYRRHLGDRYKVAMLFAEFANQCLVGGKHAQRNLGLVIGQRIERGKRRRNDRQRIAGQQQYSE